MGEPRGSGTKDRLYQEIERLRKELEEWKSFYFKEIEKLRKELYNASK
jgi:hypothetical protein